MSPTLRFTAWRRKTLLIVDNYVDIKTLRYILIDIKTKSEKLYHCGASSKDAGNKITTIVQLDDIEVYRSMFEELYTRQEQMKSGASTGHKL